MDTVNDKKLKSLLASFNLLKDSYESHAETLGEIILKSMLIDVDISGYRSDILTLQNISVFD